jgi:hypothetical protein
VYWSLEQHEWYAHGDCGLLAFTIHDLTGWPVVYSPDWPCRVRGCAKQHDGGPHMLVRHPCGQLLDIDGLHCPGDDGHVTIYDYADDIEVFNSFFGNSITLGVWRAEKESFYELTQAQVTHDALNVIASSMIAGVTGEAT